ncbi:LacI family DNA-binding transcriptional regulator [Streptomyces sp. 6N223]|uniref:LacI family DNA-binding transcriptional regulator n=1 Tax=Streptomyces sp. 6N223 TaxID=3457412 RepID=UPI003FD47C15
MNDRLNDRLNDRPNDRTNAGPAAARTRALGLVFPPADHSYTAMQLDFIGRVAEAAQAHDYDVLLTTGKEVDDPPFQRILTDRRVDGLILMEIRLEDARAEHLTALGFPFVSIGRPRREDSWWVDMDWAALGRGCVRHLAELGHRRIAFVNRSEAFFRIGYESAHRGLDGYNQGMAELGAEGRAYFCGDDDAAGRACLERILRDDPGTTAVVSINEAALGGMYRALTRAGRVVPRDFSVVHLAAGPWAESVTPPLTAADYPVDDICRIAVQLMMERLRAPDTPPRHVLLKRLITLRSSTGPVRPVPGVHP